ncbi:MAG: hypothetical protein QOH69_2431 [Actinomycetota bacterium]|jgi:molybdopterin/thiamine biosynthesis adenylyltransferase|nr:hypothetical protein [Actinomycetota bacterium]
MANSWKIVIAQPHWRELEAHLFPGDDDEHAAVLRCGLARSKRGYRLLVHDVVIARDGVDYVPGTRGYRRLLPEFVSDVAESCADEQLIYIGVHCHGGDNEVEFSNTDIASHERGYPALLDITAAPAVGALVFAERAVAGDIWLADGNRVEISELLVVGRPQIHLTPQPIRSRAAARGYDRQVRLFGDRGQDILSRQKVAIIGLGGAGSLVSEYLARLGVGTLLLVDPDRVETTNLPRLVGARRFDAMAWLTNEDRPVLIQRLGHALARYKVDVAARVARQASPDIHIDTLADDVIEPNVAAALTDCDFVFLCADSHSARRLTDVLTHQYLIPSAEVGAKINLDEDSGDVTDVFSVSRVSSPGGGCLRCNFLVSPRLLQEEGKSDGERRRGRYLDDEDVSSPSVIALNAVAASQAVDDYLMAVTGLVDPSVDLDRWVGFHPATDELEEFTLRKDPTCTSCGPTRFARGDAVRLPVRLK